MDNKQWTTSPFIAHCPLRARTRPAMHRDLSPIVHCAAGVPNGQWAMDRIHCPLAIARRARFANGLWTMGAGSIAHYLS